MELRNTLKSIAVLSLIDALTCLNFLFENNNQCVSFLGQFNSYSRDFKNGLIPKSTFDLERNRILSATLELIDTISKDTLKSPSVDKIKEWNKEIGKEIESIFLNENDNREKKSEHIKIKLPSFPRNQVKLINGETIDWIPEMNDYCGETTFITEENWDGAIKINADKGKFWWAKEWVEFIIGDA